MSDRIFGGVGLLLAAFFIWGATEIELSFISDPFGPRAFPIMIAIVMAISSLVVLARPGESPEWPALPKLAEIALAIVVMTAYAMLLPDLGFVIATALASGFLTWRLGTRPVWSAVTGVLIAGGIYTVFHLILGLSLARGPLGF
ncbi:MAG: tripartite tricarboxylate transporter TctB family protein [Rhodospirillales bacterium]